MPDKSIMYKYQSFHIRSSVLSSAFVSYSVHYGIKQEWRCSLSCLTTLFTLNKSHLPNFVLIQSVQPLHASFIFLKHILTIWIFSCLTEIFCFYCCILSLKYINRITTLPIFFH
jgi:hypothetical protein